MPMVIGTNADACLGIRIFTRGVDQGFRLHDGFLVLVLFFFLRFLSLNAGP